MVRLGPVGAGAKSPRQRKGHLRGGSENGDAETFTELTQYSSASGALSGSNFLGALDCFNGLLAVLIKQNLAQLNSFSHLVGPSEPRVLFPNI
jgi:hypothetical protein